MLAIAADIIPRPPGGQTTEGDDKPPCRCSVSLQTDSALVLAKVVADHRQLSILCLKVAQDRAAKLMQGVLSECSTMLEIQLLPRLDVRSQLTLAGTCADLRSWLTSLPKSYWQASAQTSSNTSLSVLTLQLARC